MRRAYSLWLERLRSGRLGEHPDRPDTWKYDAMWRAACYERNAEDSRRAGLHSAADDWHGKMVAALDEAVADAQRERLRVVR